MLLITQVCYFIYNLTLVLINCLLLLIVDYKLHILNILCLLLTHDPIMLPNILFVPHIAKNLLSVSKLRTDNNVFVEFVTDFCYIKARKVGNILLKRIAQKGLYQVKTTFVST